MQYREKLKGNPNILKPKKNKIPPALTSPAAFHHNPRQAISSKDVAISRAKLNTHTHIYRYIYIYMYLTF
jgi:hypothetical protein